MWSFCRISHWSSISMALHLRNTEWQMHALQRMGDTSYKVSGPYHFSEVFKGPVVKGVARTSSPKERSSYFIFHLPLRRRQQKACESSLDSHLELLLLPRRLGDMEILDPWGRSREGKGSKADPVFDPADTIGFKSLGDNKRLCAEFMENSIGE